MKYFAIEYRYPADSQAIVDTRPVHREFLGALKENGTLVGSGPFLDAEGGALIVIRLGDEALIDEVEELFDQDPFYQQGLLDSRIIRPWNPVLNVFN